MSSGCAHCYAEGVANRFAGRKIWGAHTERRTFGDSHWQDPIKWNRKAQREGNRHKVFCGSMMDVFEDHPTAKQERKRLFETIRNTPNLDWQLLTKRPKNIRRFLPKGYWSNVWLGTSVEDNTVVSRVAELMANRDRCPVMFLSLEPMIGAVDVDLDGIDWVIIGGESGPGARPMQLSWARQLIRDCRASDVEVFVKQMGSHWAKKNGAQDSKGALPTDWPEEFRIREFPNSHLLIGHQ